METPRHFNITSSFLESTFFCPKYEKQMGKAFYNGIALVLIGVCSIFAFGSFVILQPFLKPLFWALLCGSVLHPLKHSISSHFKTWIIWVEDTSLGLPIMLGLVSCPVKLFFDLSEYVGEAICRFWIKILGCIIVVLISGVVYSYTPQIMICLSWKILNMIIAIPQLATDTFQNITMVTSVILGFLLSITFFWDSKYEKQFLIASYAVWFSLSAHLASYCYLLKLPVFVAIHLLFVIGFLVNKFKALKTVEEPKVNENNDKAELKMEPLSPIFPPVTRNRETKHPQRQINAGKNILAGISYYSSKNTSDFYISWVSIACLVTLVLQSGWVPYTIALLFFVYLVKRFYYSFGVSEFVGNYYNIFSSWVLEWYASRKDVLIPAPISSLNSIFIEVRVWLLRLLRKSSDSAASVMVILGLVLFLTFGSMFLVVQAYTEGVYMIKVGGSVINQTVVHNPELMQLLPEGWEQKMDSVLNNAYTYGRQGLSKLVRNTLTGLDEEKVVELEKRALEVWDRVYQAWMMSAIEEKTMVGPKVTSSAVYQTWNNFLDAMHKTPELVSMSALTQLAQNNMAILTSGLESVWDIIKGNASLVFSFLITIFTLVFSHSFAVFNFCISTIVFLTALFYLLSSSRNLYKPVELITAISPVFGRQLAFAMENAVKEVLTASFKLALFYGMWTWLIHNLFQMKIVYIPSVFAAMLAVVPALGTYWACLPAVLDLWLAQGKQIHAITLAVCQFLPTLFVDATIYTEIKEGHPYLTGLSVVGGLFYMGMEGAIIGPLILCCLYVVVSLSSSIAGTSMKPMASLLQR